MNKQLRRIITLIIALAALFFGGYSSLKASTGFVIRTGSIVDEAIVGTRFRSFNVPLSNELFVGIPDLSYGGNRKSKTYPWVNGNNQFAFELNRATDMLTTTVTNSIFTESVVHKDVSKRIATPDTTFFKNGTLNDINVLEIIVADRDPNTVVDLLNVHINGTRLGDFGVNQTGVNVWSITNYNFNQPLVITGTVYLSGVFSLDEEKSYIDINLGITKQNTTNPDRICGVREGASYYFSKPEMITITVPTGGRGNLDCLTVRKINAVHPNGTSSILPDAYWTISGTTSSGAAATDYSLDLTIDPVAQTFPSFSTLPPGTDQQLCQYTASAGAWACTPPASPDSKLSWTGLTTLGDFAIGQTGCTAGASRPALQIQRSGPDIRLSRNSGAASARLWITNKPYFDPAAPGSNNPILISSGLTEYTQSSAASQVDSRFYLLQEQDDCGQFTGSSNRVGKITFSIRSDD